MVQPFAFDIDNMRNVDIRTVERESLKEIQTTKINMELPFLEKALDYINQIKNPYCFLCGDTIVKITHGKTKISINESMESFFRSF